MGRLRNPDESSPKHGENPWKSRMIMVFLEDVVLYCIHVEDDFFQCIKIRDPTRMYDTLYSMVIVFKTFNLKCPHL
jgi:hypothetical protein